MENTRRSLTRPFGLDEKGIPSHLPRDQRLVHDQMQDSIPWSGIGFPYHISRRHHFPIRRRDLTDSVPFDGDFSHHSTPDLSPECLQATDEALDERLDSAPGGKEPCPGVTKGHGGHGYGGL
jgi:hypothetical protein